MFDTFYSLLQDFNIAVAFITVSTLAGIIVALIFEKDSSYKKG